MRNLLVPVEDDPGQEARVACAIDVARAVNGSLHCLEVLEPGQQFASSPDVVYGAGPRLAEEASEPVVRGIVKRLDRAGVDFSWTKAGGNAPQQLTKLARLNDLVVTSSYGQTDTFSCSQFAGRLALDCGRPILAVAHGRLGINLAARSVIAWNGSLQAQAALRAAIPLLRLGSSTTVLCIGSASGEESALAVAAYCSRHGISATVCVERRTNHDVAKQLILACEKLDAGWLIAGAFGHSRGDTTMFGATARRLLRSSSIPLFMALAS